MIVIALTEDKDSLDVSRVQKQFIAFDTKEVAVCPQISITQKLKNSLHSEESTPILPQSWRGRRALAAFRGLHGSEVDLKWLNPL